AVQGPAALGVAAAPGERRAGEPRPVRSGARGGHRQEMLAVTPAAGLIDLRRRSLGRVGNRRIRKLGRDCGEGQTARSVAPLAADRPVSGLGALVLAPRTGTGGVTDQALVPRVVGCKPLAQEVLPLPRVGCLTLGPVPSRSFGGSMVREPQGAD